MNLHQIVRGAIRAVNPDVLGSVLRPIGTTTAPNGKRVPQYSRQDRVTIQVQPLSPTDIKQLDSLNIQGVERAAYVNGAVRGIDRKTGSGGDLLFVLNAYWLVAVVLEPWDGAEWSKVGITQQVEPPA